MAKPKLTKWFPREVKPVRVGVYETDANFYKGYQRFQHWNGEFWNSYCTTIQSASTETDYSSYQNVRWRGLAEQPKEQKK